MKNQGEVNQELCAALERANVLEWEKYLSSIAGFELAFFKEFAKFDLEQRVATGEKLSQIEVTNVISILGFVVDVGTLTIFVTWLALSEEAYERARKAIEQYGL